MAEKGYDITLMVDGGSRGNPGPAAIGAVIMRDGLDSVCISEYIGEATNNEAEYMALIIGLKNAKDIGAQSIHVKADSMLMVKQLLGQFKIKSENIKPLHAEAKALLREYASVGIEHIPRELNSAADELVNEALDAATGKTKKKRSAADKLEPCPKATGPLISFLSDFGLTGADAPIQKGIIKQACPTAEILDITHLVSPKDMTAASAIFESAAPHIIAAVHLVLVPSSDTVTRGVIIVTARGDFLVGRDNGILLAAAEKLGGITMAYDAGDAGGLARAAALLAACGDPATIGPETPTDKLTRLTG